MKIGVPKEILVNENRVSITPAWVRTLVEQGHEVLIQSQAGIGSSFEVKVSSYTLDAFMVGDPGEMYYI